VYFNDIWRFNVQTRTWTQLAVGPSERFRHCLEWDQGRNRLIMFGGIPRFATPLNDLWTFSIKSNQWQQVTPAGNSIPPGRYNHACAFNTQLTTFYFQGGWGQQSYQDLWQFDFTSNRWTLVDAGNSNVNRNRHSMQYSKSLNSLLLFFGMDTQTSTLATTVYQFSFNNPSIGWTLFQASGSQMPPARAQFSIGFNPQTGEYFVFGGENGATYYSTNISSRILMFYLYLNLLVFRRFVGDPN
jgi:hypothetical protein